MIERLNKADFYKKIAELKKFYGLDTPPINMVQVCNRVGIRVGFIDWETPGLRGVVYNNEVDNKKYILLSSKRNKNEQNIDCAHEFIHATCHFTGNTPSFNCYDKIKKQQDRYLEWQANEGAAEIMVPYKSFIPLVKGHHIRITTDYKMLYKFKRNAAELYRVTPAVIEFRMESLKYEIEQHIKGVPINRLEFTSNTELLSRGVNVSSINDIEKNNHTRSCII